MSGSCKINGNTERVYFDCFDWLRFAGCLLILVHHFDVLCNYLLPLDRIPFLHFAILNGQQVVVLFFALSGFCIAHNYRNRVLKREVRIGAFAYKHFMHFLSLILVTLPATAVMEIIMWRAGVREVPNAFEFILEILGLRTGYNITNSFGYNAPMWFINVLLLLYLIYYVITYLCKTRTKYIVICLILTVFALSQADYASFAFFIFEQPVVIGMLGFFAGVLLYELYDYYKESRAAMKRLSIMFIVLLAAGIAVIFANIHWFAPDAGLVAAETNDLFGRIRVTLLVLIWIPLIFLGAQIRYPQKKRLRRVSSWLGKYATSIYIWHYPVLYIIYPLSLIGVYSWTMGVCAVSLIAVFAVAAVSCAFLEKRMERGVKAFWKK